MPIQSINTNAGSLIALQNLNTVSDRLQQVQTRISTGLLVSGPKDNGGLWSIAQTSRASVSALDVVKQSLQRAQSTVDVAISAGQTISDVLNQVKSKALAGADTSLDTTSRTALNNDVKALINQIQKITATADFNGTNIIKTSGASIYAMANASGTTQLTVKGVLLGIGGVNTSTGIIFTANASFTTATTASTFLSLVNTSITQVNASVAKLGTGSNALSTHLTFISNLQDSLTQGIGNLVDADVAKESANLTALQTKQQLSIQSLSIANSSKTALLGLFR
jgi:flagellin